MSRAYMIRVSEKLTRHVVVRDGIECRLEVLPILPAKRMGELIAAALAKRGFEEKDGAWVRVEEDGIKVSVDIERGTVTLSLEGEANLDLEHSREGRAAGPKDEQARSALRDAARSYLERKAAAATDAERQKLTERLDARLADLRREIDDATNEATAAALKEKAASMGEIKSIEEDADTGGLTIRVKL